MKGYLNHMETKHPHERRQHAMRVAGVVTAVIFAGWVTTFGMHAANGTPSVSEQTGSTSQTAAAAAATYPQTENQLIVSTSTDN